MMRRGLDVPVVVTHLASGSDGQSDRMRQLEALVPWSVSRPGSGPRLLVGDFNSSPGTPEYEQVRAQYRDAWSDAVAAGTARGRMDGITHKSSRIDYIFYVPSNGLELQWIDNIDTRTLTGIEASDHNPLVASFVVK
jgi:endonuclease/exonuclease/phosphatase family metal-dependent hydrolase